jgi:chromosome segregation ATPase
MSNRPAAPARRHGRVLAVRYINKRGKNNMSLRVITHEPADQQTYKGIIGSLHRKMEIAAKVRVEVESIADRHMQAFAMAAGTGKNTDETKYFVDRWQRFFDEVDRELSEATGAWRAHLASLELARGNVAQFEGTIGHYDREISEARETLNLWLEKRAAAAAEITTLERARIEAQAGLVYTSARLDGLGLDELSRQLDAARAEHARPEITATLERELAIKNQQVEALTREQANHQAALASTNRNISQLQTRLSPDADPRSNLINIAANIQAAEKKIRELEQLRAKAETERASWASRVVELAG